MSTNKKDKSGLKKSAYIVPAVLTMAILPSVLISGAAQANKGCSSKSGCAQVSVPESGMIGLFGLGLAGLAATRLIKKNKNKNKDEE